MVYYLLILGIGFVFGYFLNQIIALKKGRTALKDIEERLEENKKIAEKILSEAREKSLVIVEESKKERERILEDVLEREKRISQREEIIDERELALIEKEKFLNERLKEVEGKKASLEEKERFIEETIQKISGFSKDEALKILFEKIEKEHESEILSKIVKLRQKDKNTLDEEAKNYIIETIPRYVRSVVSEVTTTTVSLPSEEMKGRIIGKEGRNIKHFENLTGVEIVIDETPDVVLLSSFDPIRREVARLALEKLIKDGRINPANIEEKIEEAKNEVEKIIEEAGKNASFEIGLFDLPQEIMILMGRTKFRYSYGQNVLQHSIEVATFARMLAEELGLDPYIAKKAGFLHDIGKAVTHELEGNHLEIGIKILERFNIENDVILAMRSHHETYPFANSYAFLVLAADAISAHRLGARRETTEIYLQRLHDLEKIANSFEEVEKSYAFAGGRELRAFVKANLVSDLEIYKLAKDIASKIEKELRYPGEIKVVVIKENRAIEYAK
ncbi:MAG: ribonuclease Y [Candidatus Parcubacteria bacterium]|nr:MAG: ribonuclease Y [Candidatus Parcubacteria bacterium]